MTLTILPLDGLPEVEAGMDLGELVAQSVAIEEGDVVVLAQKVVSKAEGRVVRLDHVEPSARARELAGTEADARHVEVILRESVRIVRARGPLVIAETRHGLVCASAGANGVGILMTVTSTGKRTPTFNCAHCSKSFELDSIPRNVSNNLSNTLLLNY